MRIPVVITMYEYHCVQFATVASDWSARCELIYSAARPSLPFLAPKALRGMVVASQTSFEYS